MRRFDLARETGQSSIEDLRRMVGPDRRRPGPAYGRLREEQIPVWAIIGHLRAIAGTTDPSRFTDKAVAQVAVDYDVQREAVLASMLYYKEHQCAIDTLLEANAEATA